MDNHNAHRSDVDEREKEQYKPDVPYFELYTVFIMLGLAYIFIFTDLMEKNAEVYQVMHGIAIPEVWGAGAFISFALIFLGLILDKCMVRAIGCTLAGVLWFFISSGSMSSLPNMLAFIGFVNGAFCFVMVNQVKHTNLISEKRKNKRKAHGNKFI